jgi:hypothetical protein
MFFRSPVSLLLAIIMILVGSVQFYLGSSYGNAAKGEASTIGVITYISGGRSSTYNYKFEIDGVPLQQDSGTCQTALTTQGCTVGASVLVYYSHTPVLETRLQEFGAASREKHFLGSWVAGCGFILIGLYVFLKKAGEDSEALEEPGESENNG